MGHLFVPRRVHSNGTHLSYNVTHFHEFNHPNEIDSEQLDKLHYHIDLHDETLHIELEWVWFRVFFFNFSLLYFYSFLMSFIFRIGNE